MICGDAISFPIIFSLPAQWFIKVYFVAGTPPITSNLILREISKTSKVSIRHNSVSRAITGRKKNDAKKPKKEFILGASLPFQKLSRIWKGFLGIWDLYEIPENAKFLEGVRDLTTTRQAGFPKIFARDVVLEKKMVFGMIKMTEVPVARLSWPQRILHSRL